MDSHGQISAQKPHLGWRYSLRRMSACLSIPKQRRQLAELSTSAAKPNLYWKNMSKIRRPNTKQLRQRSLYAPVDSAGAAQWQCLYTLGKLAQDAQRSSCPTRTPKNGVAEILRFNNPTKPDCGALPQYADGATP